MQNLKALREMSEAGKPKHMVHVYRGGRWSVIKCEDLLPGDITSVSRSKEPIVAPCAHPLPYVATHC
jgi:magnesium-transporting ATPase (P-type)